MSLQLLFFASVKETLGCESEVFANDVKTVAELVAELSKRGEKWQATMQRDSILIAVNQTISDLNTPLKTGDEVAFFPPVTGG